MMKRFLLVKSGVVVNVIVADDAFAASLAGSYDHIIDQAGLSAGIGWGYSGGQWTAQAAQAESANESGPIG